MRIRVALVLALLTSIACGGSPPVARDIPPTPRRLVVWLDHNGVDEATAGRLQRVGVDEVVMWRGRIDLKGQAPVLRIDPAGPVAGPIPLGIALEVSGVRPDLDEAAATAVWRALEGDLGGTIPAEVILDLPELAEGLDEFVAALQEVSGLSVVPVLSFTQLETELGRQVATAARSCIVPSFGTQGSVLRGIGERDPLPFREKLAPLVDSGVRVRVGVVIQPKTEPPLQGPGDDLDPLTEKGVASVSTSSVLDRTFTFARSASWSGRKWSAGDTLAVRWIDASRLRAAIAESQRLLLPELGGWDLMILPPDGRELGLSRETLIRFLGGEGPEPTINLDVERNGRSLQVRMTNTGPFATAVSNHGNWLEVSVEEGWMTVDERGSFEHLTRGTVSGGKWDQGDFERVNAARFFEVYLAPGETVTSGTFRVPSSRSRVIVRYNLTLFDGTSVTGEIVS
ncbi:MAG: hypothetical protein QNL88_13535 [Acidobacteriota bacterium]|nr:hypothetical protein [Acidobacteriota bacterium]